MRLASLGSGSSGNGTLIELNSGKLLLIDCGFSAKETTQRFKRLSADAADLLCILLTHEHSDHSNGAIALSKQLNIPIYCSYGTWLGLKNRKAGHNIEVIFIEPDIAFMVDSLHITPVSVPHDAREPTQFIINCEPHCVGVLTDLGSFNNHVINSFSQCNTLLIEANHDLEMLEKGPYHQKLKQRIASGYGHLNNQQTANLIHQLNAKNLIKNLIVGHLSQTNNHWEKVKEALAIAVANIENVHYACQNNGLDWITL